MEEQERYTEVCKPAFDRLETEIARSNKTSDEILRILKGRNGDPGLLDEMRDMKRFRNGILGTLGFILATLFTQAVLWFKDLLSN